MSKRLLALMVAACAAGASCTVHSTDVPSLTGPSEAGLSIRVVATPDSISQNGADVSQIVVNAFDANGQPCANLLVRMDMAVGSTLQDYGTLSARSIATGANGQARTVYTAPPPPPPSVGAGGGTVVTIVATPSSGPCGSSVGNFDATNSQFTSIRLVPVGVIQPPAGSPTADFTMSPNTALMNVPATFDASISAPGAGASQITSYSWNFGDGGQASGRTVTHSFSSPQTYVVRLTVTNDRGLSASKDVPTQVGSVDGPTAAFVFSPSSPTPGQAVLFNADLSKSALGHALVQFSWNFGDGGTASGVNVSHAFLTAGTFNVVLSVFDDTGQKGTTATSVTVVAAAGGGGGGATVALFEVTPNQPIATQLALFNASTSTAAPGRTLVNYAWDFGDGTALSGPSATTSHTFQNAGVYGVRLIVRDDGGTSAQTIKSVTVLPASTGSLLPEFTISPTDPFGGDLVTFNANTSKPIDTITQYDWDFGDGTIVIGPVSAPGQANPVATHTYSTSAGNTYTIRLTAHDATGRVATMTHTLTVGPNSGGLSPTARFTISQSPTTVGTPVTFDGSTSFAFVGASIVTYVWDFGDGSAIVSTPGPISPAHAYAAAETYTIRLTVVDNFGRTGSTTRTLLVQ